MMQSTGCSQCSSCTYRPPLGYLGDSGDSDVRSPTETSTEAYTAGNFTATVTGGAGAGATTTVNIRPVDRPKLGYLGDPGGSADDTTDDANSPVTSDGSNGGGSTVPSAPTAKISGSAWKWIFGAALAVLVVGGGTMLIVDHNKKGRRSPRRRVARARR
jgi:hypothetical protein